MLHWLPVPRISRLLATCVCAVWLSVPAASRSGDCPVETVENYTGAGSVVCPCFIVGEEAGSVFSGLPADHFPIELQSIGVGWGSVFGGSPQSFESALKVYGAGLPNPGAVLHSLAGPVLTDGVINEFPVAGLGFDVAAQPFSVTLEFANSNSGTLGPSVVHDGNGCTPGQNLVLADGSGWIDACAAGVSGDWLFFVRYLPSCTASDVPEDGRPLVASNAPAIFTGTYPNPLERAGRLEFWLAEPGEVSMDVFDARGRKVSQVLPPTELDGGEHSIDWTARDAEGHALERGIYFANLRLDGFATSTKIVVR